MRPFLTQVLVVVIGAMMSFSSPASADTIIFQDDFEGHAAGTALTAIAPTIGESYGGDYVIRDATTAPPAAAAGGAGFIGRPDTWSAYVSNMRISAADTTAVTGKVVQFDFDTYVQGKAYIEAAQFVTFLPGYVRGWDLSLMGDGSIRYYNSDDDPQYTDVGTFSTDTWVHAQVVADYGSHTFHATVGGFGFDGAWAALGANSFEQLYVAPVASGSNFFVDNVSIKLVPEPSSLALIATAMLGLVAYAWRKRK